MLGVRQWRHGAFCVSRQHRLGRLPMTKVFIHSLWNKVYSSVNHEQFRMQMTHKHNKWLQILTQEDFPPKLLWSENADFKFSVKNEGEDVNKKLRAEGTSLSTAKATPTTRDRNRRLESEALWSFYTVLSLPVSLPIDRSRSVSALYYGPRNNNFQANCTRPYSQEKITDSHFWIL